MLYLNDLHRALVATGAPQDLIDDLERQRVRRFVEEFDTCKGRLLTEQEYVGEMERRYKTQ